MAHPNGTRAPRRALALPTTLAIAVVAVAASACSNPNPGPQPCGASDSGTDACSDLHEDDGAVRYTVCPSQVNCDCARLVYPDGAVVDPTFC